MKKNLLTIFTLLLTLTISIARASDCKINVTGIDLPKSMYKEIHEALDSNGYTFTDAIKAEFGIQNFSYFKDTNEKDVYGQSIIAETKIANIFHEGKLAKALTAKTTKELIKKISLELQNLGCTP